jgi:glutamine synthetase
MADKDPSELTVADLPKILEHDTKVKVAGCDIDGVLRGKLMTKKKFLSIAEKGFGFCSVIFGWDMHDQTYFKELKISNKENGYRDLIAVPDLSSYRRIPWEDDVPFFLVSFFDPTDLKPISACPRGLLRTALANIEKAGYGAMAGAEYEFYQFRAPDSSSQDPADRNSSSTATFLRDNPAHTLPSLTEGMFGYSLTRPVHNQAYYYGIFSACEAFRCGIEGWHTESGPGVFEAALEFGPIADMADHAALFKYVVKSLGSKHGITPCFMAKPRQGLPGNSGHMHVSLVSATDPSKNLFARDTVDPNPPYPDIAHLSNLGRHFLAGLIDGLPDIMPLLAPTINSYKRLVENFWAPVTVSWGLEHRAASIRLIAPPTASPKATRFEVRVAGADANPYLVLAAILALGWRGVEKKMEIGVPPLGKGEDVGGQADQGVRLAKSLKEATGVMVRKGSVAREVFGDEFVEHFGGTREHEVRLWEEAVTDWYVFFSFLFFSFLGVWDLRRCTVPTNVRIREVKRYIEMV